LRFYVGEHYKGSMWIRFCTWYEYRRQSHDKMASVINYSITFIICCCCLLLLAFVCVGFTTSNVYDASTVSVTNQFSTAATTTNATANGLDSSSSSFSVLPSSFPAIFASAESNDDKDDDGDHRCIK